MLVRAFALFGVLAISACADYGEFDADSTVFKCDEQNACPDGYFCSDSPSGVCIANGTMGCKGQELVRNWDFTTTADGWIFDISSGSGITGHSFGWTPDVGAPNKGSLKLELFGSTTTSARLGWLRPDVDTLGDMRGKWISTQVWSDKPGMSLVAYVENDTMGAGWTDGGRNNLNANQWDCVGVKIDMPKFSTPGFDPAAVERFGFQLDGTLPATIILDDVGY